MKTNLNKLGNLKQGLKYALPSLLLFFWMAHHTVNFWELPALWMFLLFLVFAPLLTGLVVFWCGKLAPHLGQIPQKRLLLFLLAALLVGGFATWRLYRIPNAHHTVTISPLPGGQVGLLEVKSNFQVTPLQKAALESGWREEGGAYYATATSRPISLAFRAPPAKPVNVLFLTSPEGGAAEVSLNFQTARIELSNDRPGQSTLRLVSDYRGIPGWIFVPFVIIADLVAFGLLTLFLLIVQEVGQRSAARKQGRGLALPNHRASLLILVSFGVTIHLLNILTVPLFMGPDSPSFLQGSVHLLKYGNLDGVSMFRGPGTTFLFAPAMFIFGRNPWGLKILLHLFAVACIPVSYRLGWQLSKNQQLAFMSGLLAVLSPDLLFYSSQVMSDAPNIFIVLAFLTLILSALEHPQKRWVFFAMLVGSFAVLLRSENIVMLAIGGFVLAASPIVRWANTGVKETGCFVVIAAALLLAALPILGWSAHNQKMHGFFGMSNYQGEVFYDGWVYYGDASRFSFSDPDSPAIQAMNEAVRKFPIVVTDKSGVPTGWEIYPALLAVGYTPVQSFDLMTSAARDSILRNKEIALKLLFIKYEKGLKPTIPHGFTFPLAGESMPSDAGKSEFFEEETLRISPLILLQRQLNDWIYRFHPALAPEWVLFCIFTVLLSVLRSPWDRWLVLTAITTSRIFIPLTLGVDFWRYTLAGWMPAQIIAIAWIWLFFSGLITLFRFQHTSNSPNNW